MSSGFASSDPFGCYRARHRRDVLHGRRIDPARGAAAARRDRAGGRGAACRLSYRYPSGFCEDELHFFCQAAASYQIDSRVTQSLFSFTDGVPTALQVLFGAQILPFTTPRIAIRGYSCVGSVLSVLIAFGVLRACGVRAAGALTVAALVAVLPWSLLYGRTSQGGELVLHFYLLLWAVAVCCWGRSIAFAVWVGGLALTLLFYDYYCGRTAPLLVLGATILAPTWARRLGLVAMVAMLAIAYAPTFMVVGLNNAGGVQFRGLGIPLLSSVGAGLAAVLERVPPIYSGLTAPTASVFWMSLPAAAVHPEALLFLSGAGLLAARWPVMLLLGGAIGVGFLPSLLATDVLSTHRMLLGCAALVLPVGVAIDWLRAPLRALAAVAVIVAVTLWSVPFCFGTGLWTPESWGYNIINYHGRYTEHPEQAIACVPLDWPRD